MLKKYKIFIPVAGLILNVGCAKSPNGFAPDGQITQTPNVVAPIASSENIFKLAQSVTTVTGWQATLDYTDSIEYKLTSSGWTIEMNHE